MATASHAVTGAPETLPGIRHVIAVASAKGGVGKSTVAVNLALALQDAGGRVGLLDADIFGPSVPGMLGLPTDAPPAMTSDRKIVPEERHGLQAMSMGLLTDDDSPAILRGPMVGKYLHLFVTGVQWAPLDYLILDLPPGTGDTQLTLAQRFPLSGAVIVTTPQEVSLRIARRGVRMFETLQVPILGVIENMSTFTCPHCEKETDVFRRGGGERMSRQLAAPFLGAIPLDGDIVTCGDEGRPTFIEKPSSVAAQAYASIARELVARLQEHGERVLRPFEWKWDSAEDRPDWNEAATEPSGSASQPVGFRRRDARTLSVLWQDGRKDDLDVRDLRLACQCAMCVDETSGRPRLDPKTVRADVAPRTLSSAGNYAMAITWNDGHRSTIYSFTVLRSLGERATAAAAEDV